MNYEIVPLNRENAYFLPHPQQPFSIIGKLIPVFDGRRWSTSELIYDKATFKTYPNEKFDPTEYIDNSEQAAFLAISDGDCVGSIRVCRRWNGNGFIDDLAIDAEYRGSGIGRHLMDEAVRWSRDRGLNGMSLETQDNNLIACRFYMKYGYTLGGIDTKSYTSDIYAGEIALYFYLAFNK